MGGQGAPEERKARGQGRLTAGHLACQIPAVNMDKIPTRWTPTSIWSFAMTLSIERQAAKHSSFTTA